MKKDLLWSLSLLAIGIISIIASGSKIIGIELPDAAVWVLGIALLILTPVFIYISVKKVIKIKK